MHLLEGVAAVQVSGAEVAQIGEAYEVEIGHMTAHERLGVGPSAKRDEIELAYRERAKRCHPDTKDGDKKAMQLLNKARDEAMLIAEHKEMAA